MAGEITWRNVGVPSFSGVATQNAVASKQINSGLNQMLGVVEKGANDYKQEVTDNVVGSLSGINDINQLNQLSNTTMSPEALRKAHGNNINTDAVSKAIAERKGEAEGNIQGDIYKTLIDAKIGGANERDLLNIGNEGLAKAQEAGVGNKKLMDMFKTIGSTASIMGGMTPEEQRAHAATLQTMKAQDALSTQNRSTKYSEETQGDRNFVDKYKYLYEPTKETQAVLASANGNVVNVLAQGRDDDPWFNLGSSDIHTKDLNEKLNTMAKKLDMPRKQFDPIVYNILNEAGYIGKGIDLPDVKTDAIASLINQKLAPYSDWKDSYSNLNNSDNAFKANELQTQFSNLNKYLQYTK